MQQLSIGTIEVMGLPAAVEAADVALKTADVTLIGYETTDGMGMVAVKIEGRVSAVTAAVAAASAAAARITKVFATSVIARPSEQLPPIVFSEGTVGLAKPKAAPKAVPEPVKETAPEPVVVRLWPESQAGSEPAAQVEAVEATLVEPVETAPEVSTSSTTETAVLEPVAEASSSSAVVPEPVETPVAPPKAPATRRASATKTRTTKK